MTVMVPVSSLERAMTKENTLITGQKERTLRICRAIPEHLLVCNILHEKSQHEGQSPTATVCTECDLQPFRQVQALHRSEACQGVVTVS